MYHFFVPDAGTDPSVIRITGSDVNHIRNVLRMKVGENIVVSNGEDRDFYCKISSIEPDEVQAEILPEEVEESELSAQLILFQGLPKGDKMELIIQKAVELGAYRVVPVAMKRSVMKMDEKKQQKKIPRWNGISESAAKQSGRRIIPEVTGVYTWKEVLAETENLDMMLVPYENARGMVATKEALAALQPGQKIGIVIGPEGGFDPSEIESLEARGARTISLGHRILRTETAGLAALTMCMLELECR